MSTAVTAPTAKNDLRAVLTGEAMKKQISLALPKQVAIDRFLRVLLTTINKTPKLLECTRESVLAAVMDCAQLGLEPDNTLGRAYILPYKGKAQLIIGYKGYIDLFYRSGQGAGLIAEAVYEKDHFVYSLGLSPRLEHIPADQEDRGELRYAYCVCELKDGGKVWRVLNRAQVMRAKKSSQSAGSEYSPWQTAEEEMWAKTAIRAVAKRIPLSPELHAAVAYEEQIDQSRAMPTIDVPAEATPAEAPAAEESSPALSHTQRVLVACAKATQHGVTEPALHEILAKHGGATGPTMERARAIPAEKADACCQVIEVATRVAAEG